MKEEVHRANARFYQAFEHLDIREMEAVWATDQTVKCIHPGWAILVGWLDIRDSWDAIFSNTEYLEFSIKHIDISIEGNLAWVTCQENMTQAVSGRSVQSVIMATNIFERKDNYWRLVHHHGSPVVRQPDSAM